MRAHVSTRNKMHQSAIVLVRCVPGSSLLPPPYWKARRPWGRGCPSRSPLFLAPIVHQISGIPKYEPTPIPRGYQLLLPRFLSRGKERSEKNGENAMKAGTTSTLLPSLIGTKHIPEFKNSSQNPKHFPESKTHLRIQKHFPESKTRPKVVWILGCVFGFWNTFWILLSVFGFREMFVNSAK